MPIVEYISDEELLLLHRMGNESALATLMERFFAMRRYSCLTASPSAANTLSEWECNEAVYHAFYNALDYYEFNQRRFLTLYHTILKHELTRMLNKRVQIAPRGVISLDEEFEEKNSGHYQLKDILPSGSECDDPKAFLSYAETLREMRRLPKGIEPETITLVSLLADGYSLRESTKILKMDEQHGRYLLRKYRRWVLEVEEKVYGAESPRLEENEKLLDALLSWNDDGEE